MTESADRSGNHDAGGAHEPVAACLTLRFGEELGRRWGPSTDGTPSEYGLPSQMEPFCPHYRRAIEIIGRRWTGAIVRSLLAGNVRFTDIRASIPNVSDRLVSLRLQELEAEGLVERRVSAGRPLRIRYQLTPKGEGLVSVVEAVSAWAEQWGTDPAEASSVSPGGGHP